MMVYDQRNKCQVLDYLRNIDKRQREKMLYLLQEYVPTEGPPHYNNQKAKHLEGDVGVQGWAETRRKVASDIFS